MSISRWLTDEEIAPVALDKAIAELKRERFMRDKVYPRLWQKASQAERDSLRKQYASLVWAIRYLQRDLERSQLSMFPFAAPNKIEDKEG